MGLISISKKNPQMKCIIIYCGQIKSLFAFQVIQYAKCDSHCLHHVLLFLPEVRNIDRHILSFGRPLPYTSTPVQNNYVPGFLCSW